MMNEAKKVEALRGAYKGFQLISELSPKEFRSAVEGARREYEDGEYEGETYSPEKWLDFAREAAWEALVRKYGKKEGVALYQKRAHFVEVVIEGAHG